MIESFYMVFYALNMLIPHPGHARSMNDVRRSPQLNWNGTRSMGEVLEFKLFLRFSFCFSSSRFQSQDSKVVYGACIILRG